MTIYREEDDFNMLELPEHARVIDWNNYRSILPIPIAEIEINPNVVQNRWGY